VNIIHQMAYLSSERVASIAGCGDRTSVKHGSEILAMQQMCRISSRHASIKMGLIPIASIHDL
jgi:hypothetical protein